MGQMYVWLDIFMIGMLDPDDFDGSGDLDASELRQMIKVSF